MPAGKVLDGVEALAGLQLAVNGEGAAAAAVDGGADQLELAGAVDQNGAGAGEHVGVEHQVNAAVGVGICADAGARTGAGDHFDGAIVGEMPAGKALDGVEALAGLQPAVTGDGAVPAAVDGGADQLELAGAVDQNGAGAGEHVGVEHQVNAAVGVDIGADAGARAGAGDHFDGAIVGEMPAGKVLDGVEAPAGLQLAVNGSEERRVGGDGGAGQS